MLHKMGGLEVSDVYEEVTREVIAELREKFLQKGVSLEVLSKLEKLWREKLKATKCVVPQQIILKNIEQPTANNHQKEIETPSSSFLNGTYILTTSLKNSKHLNNTRLLPLISSNRPLTVEEIQTALRKQRKLLSNKSSYVQQIDGSCGYDATDDYYSDDFIEVNSITDESDDDNVGDIKPDDVCNNKLDDDDVCDNELDREEIGKTDDKIDSINAKDIDDVDQSTDSCNSDEEINTDDEIVTIDPHWDECKNTVYCTSSNVKLIRTNMKFILAFKNGIMNIEGKDYVIKKLNGSGFWR